MSKIVKEFADIKQKPRLINLFNASKGLGSAVPLLIFIAIACGELGFHFIGKSYFMSSGIFSVLFKYFCFGYGFEDVEKTKIILFRISSTIFIFSSLMIIASATCCAIVIINGRSDHVFFHIGTGIFLACGAGLGEY